MEISSIKQVLKQELDKIDNYLDNLPEISILKGDDRFNGNKVNAEYARILELDHELRRLIISSERLQHIIEEAISILSNNLEIEVKQKNMLRKSLDILKNRTKPLYIEITNNSNKIFYYQNLQRNVR